MDCILFDDNFRLLIGEERDISAEDMVAEQRTVRFGAGEIRSLAGEEHHVLLVIADELQPLTSGPVQAEGLLADSLDTGAVLTEAVARGWFHTVSAAASGPLTWTHEDSKRIGQLSITGRPSLGAFLAERRKAVHRGGYDASMPAVVTPGDVEVRSALMGLLTESGSRVQFGTADLAAAGDPEIAEVVEDISDNLRLALAVEEALAADLLLEVLARRGAGVDLERGRLRAGLEEEPAIEELVSCLVVPYASLLGSDGGRSYLRIVAQLRGRFAAWRVESDEATTVHLAGVLDELEERPDASLAVRRERVVGLIMLLTGTIAERARHIDEGAEEALTHDEFVANLVAMCSAVLAA